MIHPIKKPAIPLIRYFGKRKMGHDFTQPPIIIGGCARSGTTLLQSILSAHPSIFVFPHEIAAFNKWHTDKNGNQVPARIDKLYRESLRYMVPDTATRWCTKAPSNVHHIKEILQYYNNQVKFLHLVRDIRDVVISKHPKNKDKYWVTPERWLKDIKAGLAFEDNPNVLTLRYEDLIQEFDTTVEKLCKFLEEPVCDKIKNWPKYTKLKKSSAIFGQIGPLHNNSIGKWKQELYKPYIDELMGNQEIHTLLKHYGYL